MPHSVRVLPEPVLIRNEGIGARARGAIRPLPCRRLGGARRRDDGGPAVRLASHQEKAMESPARMSVPW